MTPPATSPTGAPTGRGARVAARAGAALRRHDGAFTRELARVPGAFGRGQVPARLEPDRVVPAVAQLSQNEEVEIAVRNARRERDGSLCKESMR